MSLELLLIERLQNELYEEVISPDEIAYNNAVNNCIEVVRDFFKQDALNKGDNHENQNE